MIEKYLYDDYSIGFEEDFQSDSETYYFIFNQRRELYLTEGNIIPLVDDSFLDNFNVNFNLLMGYYKNKPCVVVNVDDEGNFHGLDEVYGIDNDTYQMATRAVLISDWYRLNQYCGKCGHKTRIKENSMALECPKCHISFHGKIQPAVIIAIHNEDKLLMARHTYDTKVRYALIAGFVEMGESIEETVHREVKEEVGLNIKNLEYMGSQPWPFPNSLMCAYKAEYDSGQIRVDENEIVEARWFSKDEIEHLESDISIYSLLIDDFINNN